ncbi:hypothetical protein [Sphingomonas sp. TREG-RG-20F-R18-01]|uniref:hypothetical protein n=1 Tax=Sphingomonas sp. TREG-RG-20F-R18-01 TaxID=2914982 RepID=UPI001F5A6C8F|nr:hypothetical protein [Sphingomonas sp. TREG-RG-20F-R18-01]
MLTMVEQRGDAIAAAAADRARRRVAAALRAALPGILVEISGAEIVLVGRIAPDDPRLRWIGSLVR